MFAHPGYYSLVQFCPDHSRLEAVNVGVVLFCPALSFLDLRLADNNDRVARVFRPRIVRSGDLDSAKKALADRLHAEAYRPRTPEEFEKFVFTRGNALLLTPPRPTRVDHPEDDLNALFQELVLPPSTRKTPRFRVVSPELARVFAQLALEGRAQRNVKARVPVVGKEIRAPFAYRNGVLHLVKPHLFSAEEGAATSAAMKLAVEGDLLARHGTDAEGEKHLVIVAGFPREKESQAIRQRVLGVLGEYKVRSVTPEQVASFAEEVKREAKAT
jgi:hypothetical protein